MLNKPVSCDMVKTSSSRLQECAFKRKIKKAGLRYIHSKIIQQYAKTEAVKHMRSRNKGWERQSRQAQPKCKQSDAGLGASGPQPKKAGGLRWLLPHHVRYDDSGENVMYRTVAYERPSSEVQVLLGFLLPFAVRVLHDLASSCSALTSLQKHDLFHLSSLECPHRMTE
jgi:hypothetical protein